MTLFITHPACLEHLNPPGHPERPERLRAIEQVMEHEKFSSSCTTYFYLGRFMLNRSFRRLGLLMPTESIN